MEPLTLIYLVYSFLGLYYLFLFTLIYIQNKHCIYEIPEIKKQLSLTMVVPCYNAEKQIGETIENLLRSDYKGLKKVIVVDDCSTDNSYKIAKKFQKKYPKKVKVVQTPKNTGCAAGSKNYGAKFVRTKLIGFTDDDSYPKQGAISKMIGYFGDEKTGGVTSRVLVMNRDTWISKLQAIEYKIIAFTRKLLGFVGGIYVTNGPLSIYRLKAFKEAGGFDESNWTEDIEITWHIVSLGYNIHMAVPAKVYTVVPDRFKAWFKQRLRWNVGGIQTINKYKKSFFKCGMLGLFILPFFVVAWFLAITGLFLLGYRIIRTVYVRYLSTTMSIANETAILNMKDIHLTPSILFFFGVVLFFLGLLYNILALRHSKDEEEKYKKQGFGRLLIYMTFYLTAYPAILIISIYKFFKGKKTWN
ncbi:glycosyltransferase [Candidatus Pacearchaeota archaeon]|nr:glycosyltransferase [Candidatus Pacearchaeota archaeon]